MRITAGYSHVEVSPLQRTLNMKGSRKRTRTLLCSLPVNGATLPCANNRRLSARRRVHPFMCSLGSGLPRAMCGKQCTNNRRLFAHRPDPGAMCEQPPVIRTSKGLTQGLAHERVGPRGPCANNRRLFAHESVGPRGPCANNRRLFAHERVGPRGPCANNRRLFAHYTVGPSGAMCEQPLVIIRT